MKTNRLLITLLLVAMTVQVALADEIKIVGQNVQNFFYSLDDSRTQTNSIPISNYNTEAGRTAKLNAIIEKLSVYSADIYAFNEVECHPEVLKLLAQAMSTATGKTYQAVNDNLTADAGYIKSGFIYNTATIETLGSNVSTAVGYTYTYPYQMRMQAFKSKASGEIFVLSMNHFKASTSDDINVDIEKRKQNAASLLQGLGAAAAIDSDILIMGDLNAEIDEESLQQIINAGYEEQLLKYYTGAMYTHCYDDGSLIDHVMANNTMAAQVKNAEIMHVANVCSTGSKWNAYSDHDPYMVTLDLKESEFQCVDIAFSESFSDDFGKFSTVNVAGTKNWFVNTSYHYANMNAYGDGVNDDWLISPKFDLRQKSSATLKFNHCAGYGVRDNWINEMKVLVSDNYFDHLGNPGDATWTDLGAAFDTSGNWKWKNNTITIPSQFIGKDKVYVAFHYTCSDSNIPSWEVKNVELTATCTETGIHTVSAERWIGGFRKVMENGRLVIMTPDGKRYTLQGIEQR